MAARKLRVADPDPLAGYPPEFLACRVDRHRWSREPEWDLVQPGLADRTRECEVCGSEARQLVSMKNWQRVGQVRYVYAPGYAKRRAGLITEDYRTAYYAGDFARAQRDGRVG